MTNSEFGALCAHEIIAAKKKAEIDCEPFMQSNVATIITLLLENEGGLVKRRRKPKNAPKPRARDAVFDVLARIDGQDAKQLTQHGAGRIGNAKKQILEVILQATPDATTEQVVAEIELRAAAYKRKHPTRELTAMALVTWWGGSGGPSTTAAKRNIYIEPPGWRGVAAVLYAGTDMHTRAWLDLSPDYRTAICADIERNAPPE